jgi:hypothetical protein
MVRSGFKKKTLEEIREKQAIKRERDKLKPRKPATLKKSSFKTKSALASKNGSTWQITPKKRKEKTQAQLKKDLDTVFSLYVRQIYPKVCYTCNKPAERLQCGHYISRQYLVTRWSIDNCRPQCWGCNGYGKGQPLIFEEKLKAEYGNDFVEKMKASRHQMMKVDRNWYAAEIAKYKSLLK